MCPPIFWPWEAPMHSELHSPDDRMPPAPQCDYYWPPALERCVERYEEEYGVQESSRYVVTVDGQRWSVSVGSNEVFVDTVIELGGK